MSTTYYGTVADASTRFALIGSVYLAELNPVAQITSVQIGRITRCGFSRGRGSGES